MEIIPWLLRNNYYNSGDVMSAILARDQTVFVGGIPGDFTATELALAFQNEFRGCVAMVRYHTDKSRYPRGELLLCMYTSLL